MPITVSHFIYALLCTGLSPFCVSSLLRLFRERDDTLWKCCHFSCCQLLFTLSYLSPLPRFTLLLTLSYSLRLLSSPILEVRTLLFGIWYSNCSPWGKRAFTGKHQIRLNHHHFRPMEEEKTLRTIQTNLSMFFKTKTNQRYSGIR